jgi:hypothetical protein
VPVAIISELPPGCERSDGIQNRTTVPQPVPSWSPQSIVRLAPPTGQFVRRVRRGMSRAGPMSEPFERNCGRIPCSEYIGLNRRDSPGRRFGCCCVRVALGCRSQRRGFRAGVLNRRYMSRRVDKTVLKGCEMNKVGAADRRRSQRGQRTITLHQTANSHGNARYVVSPVLCEAL